MAETPTTAVVTIFPTQNDVVGGDVIAGLSAAGSGKTIGELVLRYANANPYLGINYVKQGTYALVSGRTFRINSLIANIAGYLVLAKATAETLTGEASLTNYVWLQLVRNASAQVTGARWLVTTSTTAPALPTNGVAGDQVLVHQLVVAASSITSQVASPRMILHAGKTIVYDGAGGNLSTGGIANDANAQLWGFGGFPVLFDGTLSVDIEWGHNDASSSSVAGRWDGVIFTDTLGGTSVVAHQSFAPTSTFNHDFHPRHRYAPAAGLRTFVPAVKNKTGGTATLTIGVAWFEVKVAA